MNRFQWEWVIVLAIAVGAAGGAIAQAGHAVPPPRRLRVVLGCLLTQPPVVDVLSDLGLRRGENATVRFYRGSVPGIPQSEGYFVLLYSHNHALAWLLMAGPSGHGKVWPYQGGAFNFDRAHGRLSVVEGFGGLATYKTYGDFARWIEAHEPLIKVRLGPCARCCGPLPAG